MPRSAVIKHIICLRCRKIAEVMSTDDPRDFEFYKIGLNLYYCDKCAKEVGWWTAAGAVLLDELPSNSLSE
ncbi:hypothetical protein IF1G_11171 [Cordyceps javanica]|uniref:Uncharacterized protein n=1 Tax=Cordyceps javanica TaxID=43265 RepID=A0A545UL27_9HYPO|nr:hypothetical protein IF1G_11171 [Cordyceps javanica]